MDIEDMSIKELKNRLEKKESIKNITNVVKGTPFKVGASYLIRTVTMIYTGKLEKVFNGWFVLSNCSWIAETERWADTVEKGSFKEVEPYGDKEVVISQGGVLDMTEVNWKLPDEQK